MPLPAGLKCGDVITTFTQLDQRGAGFDPQAAHTKLSHSKVFIVRAYPLQTHEMLFDALTQAFRVLGGVPRRGIFDNMKTAVDRIGAGKVRQVNARFAAMASLSDPMIGKGCHGLIKMAALDRLDGCNDLVSAKPSEAAPLRAEPVTLSFSTVEKTALTASMS